MSTYFPKEGDIVRKWFVVDATGLPLGRLASRVARILIGKEKPEVHAVYRHWRPRGHHKRREDQDHRHERRSEGLSPLPPAIPADCARKK